MYETSWSTRWLPDGVVMKQHWLSGNPTLENHEQIHKYLPVNPAAKIDTPLLAVQA